MNKDDLLYMAGAIDCDGSIGITINTRAYIRKDGTPGTPQFVFFINLRQSDRGKGIIEFADALFGVGACNFKPSNNMWTWQTGNQKEVLFICEALLPYLKIKKPEAEKMIYILKRWLNEPRTPELRADVIRISNEMNPSQQK